MVSTNGSVSVSKLQRVPEKNHYQENSDDTACVTEDELDDSDRVRDNAANAENKRYDDSSPHRINHSNKPNDGRVENTPVNILFQDQDDRVKDSAANAENKRYDDSSPHRINHSNKPNDGRVENTPVNILFQDQEGKRNEALPRSRALSMSSFPDVPLISYWDMKRRGRQRHSK